MVKATKIIKFIDRKSSDKKFYQRYRFWASIGGIIWMVIIRICSEFEIIKEFIITYPVVVIWLFAIILLSLIYSVLGCVVLKNDRSIDREFRSNYANWSVLIIDDQPSYRKKLIESLGNNLNIIGLTSLTSLDLLWGFDIIIIDMVGASSLTKDKSAEYIIQQINRQMPFKYVIAISSEQQHLDKVMSQVDFYLNKSEYDFEKKLQNHILSIFDKMSNSDDYWKEILKKLQRNNIVEKDLIKKQYICNFISQGKYME